MEMKTLTIKCLSPVHIGSGRVMKSFEYLYNPDKSEVIFVERSAWISFLVRHGIMDEFANYIQVTAKALSSSGNFYGMMPWEWLRQKGIAAEDIEAVASHKSFATLNTICREDKDSLNDINACVTLSNGMPYIPGSSIKGALRTSILYSLLMKPENSKFRARIWNEIEASGDIAGKDVGKAFRRLETDLLSKLEKYRNDMLNSSLRGLKISDTMCVSGSYDTVVLQKRSANVKGNGPNEGEHGLPIFLECIPGGTSFEIQVTADYTMLSKIGLDSINAVFDCSREFVSYNRQVWAEIFSKDYPSQLAEMEAADLWLGAGTGFLSKTLVYAIAPETKKSVARKLIASYLDRVFKKPGHNHWEEDKLLSPRAIKLTQEGQYSQVMGLCKVFER